VLYEDSQTVLDEVEAHLLGISHLETLLVKSAWRHTGGVVKYIKRGLREFFRHGVKFYCWQMTLLVACVVTASFVPQELRWAFAMLLPLALIFLPLFLTVFSVPSTYSHGGILIDDVKNAFTVIADKGFAREVLDVLKSNIEKLEQPSKQRVTRLQIMLGGAWAFWCYWFWNLPDPKSVVSTAGSGVVGLAVYSLALFIFFLLVQGYSKAHYVLYTSIYYAIDEHKWAALVNAPEALQSKALKPAATAEGDLFEALALRLSAAGDGLRPGQPLSFDCGERIKRLREESDITTSQFIELIGYPSEKWYGKVEEGRVDIEEAFLIKASEATGASLAWLKHGSGRVFETQSIRAFGHDAFRRIRELNPSELYLLIAEPTYGFHGIAYVEPHRWVNICFDVSLDFHNWWGDERCIPEIREFVESCFVEPGIHTWAYLVRGDLLSEGPAALDKHPKAITELLRRSRDARPLTRRQLLPAEGDTYDRQIDDGVIKNIREGFRLYGYPVSKAS
jgi:transcriptional regulator with XRE-family HTH domain